MNPIHPLATPMTLHNPTVGKPPDSAGGASFKDYLLSSIQEVNTMQHAADQAVENLVTGGDVHPAEALTAVQKADLAFRMMVQIRNKIVQAYQEVQNMRV
jgi:flagellar hook-basal body complex protein FliE